MGTPTTQTSSTLYRKYRSKSLDEVIGQSHITDILKRSLAQGKVAHAYLLTGPRGVGKTSIARILAHEINGLPYIDDATHLDIIEIDAASNNGVDDIRELRDRVQVGPVLAKRKIYIIDEVHMLSKPAFNALLKTLEEPPDHVVFILATTDTDKLPATIVSRTQRFGFHAITEADIVRHLRAIATKEHITIADDALDLLAILGDGSFRDSISLLDQLSGLSDSKDGITAELVEQTLGLAPATVVETLIKSYRERNLTAIVDALKTAEAAGVQPSLLSSQLIRAIRHKIIESPELLELLDKLLEVTKSSQPAIKLLTVLGSHAVPAPKRAALVATAKVVHEPQFAALAKKATQEHPAEPVAPKKLRPTVPFDWTAMVEYTRLNFVALYSVLCKCTHDLVGSDIQLYTGNAFYKKKLDDAKYRSKLFEILETLGVHGFDIITIGTPPPPKDARLQAIAAIMGGGEEVSVDETS